MSHPHHGKALSAALLNSATLATAALRNALEQDTEGVSHLMGVPRLRRNGSVFYRREKADSFPRATIMDALLDARDVGIDVPHQLIMDECARLVRNKRQDVPGGWSYLENVPELPPDLDDLGSVIRTLARSGGPNHADTYEDALAYSLNTFNDDGSRNTWIMDENADGYARMRQYMDLLPEFDGCHPEVLANFLTAAYAHHPDYATHHTLRSCVDYLLSMQQADGSWQSDFYGSPCYSTMMILTALKAYNIDGAAIEAAARFLEKCQENDGSWYQGDTLATACAINGLAIAAKHGDAVHRGLQYLLRSQEADGLWTPGIFVQVFTPFGAHRQRSREITGAFCIKSIASVLLNGRPVWFNREQKLQTI